MSIQGYKSRGDGGYIPPIFDLHPPIVSASIPIIFFHHPPTMLCRKFYKYKGHSLVHPTLMLTIIGIHYIFDRVDLFYPLKQQLNSVLIKPCR